MTVVIVMQRVHVRHTHSVLRDALRNMVNHLFAVSAISCDTQTLSLSFITTMMDMHSIFWSEVCCADEIYRETKDIKQGA